MRIIEVKCLLCYPESHQFLNRFQCPSTFGSRQTTVVGPRDLVDDRDGESSRAGVESTGDPGEDSEISPPRNFETCVFFGVSVRLLATPRVPLTRVRGPDDYRGSKCRR